MSAGIVRVHGTPSTADSLNVTGRKSTFFGGYQPLFVKIQTLTATYDFSTTVAEGSDQSTNEFDQFIRACETVGTVVGYGTPVKTTAAGGLDNSCTVVVLYDAGSVNQGDGAGGQAGVKTGFGALKSALAGVAGGSVVAGDFAVTTYTGFNGTALGNN